MSGGTDGIVIVAGSVVHVLPPSLDLSTNVVAGELSWCAGLKFVTVVYTVPSGATCGSRYVAPCGLCPFVGSGCGADHGVCVPSARASAYETYGTGVTVWKFAHIV